MSTNKYAVQLFKKSTKKSIWWVNGCKIPLLYKTKQILLPKGLFFRILKIKEGHIGKISGRYVSTRKPFVKPLKEIRR